MDGSRVVFCSSCVRYIGYVPRTMFCVQVKYFKHSIVDHEIFDYPHHKRYNLFTLRVEIQNKIHRYHKSLRVFKWPVKNLIYYYYRLIVVFLSIYFSSLITTWYIYLFKELVLNYLNRSIEWCILKYECY